MVLGMILTGKNIMTRSKTSSLEFLLDGTNKMRVSLRQIGGKRYSCATL
jgi:hypothetical protein